MELGLLYYNARFYAPGLGRFLSADTIVPNPANPQQYNRYTYSLNSPINYADPDGHNPVWCNDPYDGGGGPECAPMVDFDILKNAGDAKWEFDEMMTVWHGAARIDFMLMQHGSSFLEVFDGTVTFSKTGTYSAEGNLGWRENQNSIWVYEHDKATVVSEGPRWVGHELGHSFDSALNPNTVDARAYGQGTIDLAISDIGYTDTSGVYIPIAGGCNNGNYLTSCYESSGDGLVSRDNASGTPMEDFADMFSGYVVGFADIDAGRARAAWMNGQMSAWISLAVTNNNR